MYDRAISLTRLKNLRGDLQYVLLGGEDQPLLYSGDEDAGTVTNIDPSVIGTNLS